MSFLFPLGLLGVRVMWLPAQRVKLFFLKCTGKCLLLWISIWLPWSFSNLILIITMLRGAEQWGTLMRSLLQYHRLYIYISGPAVVHCPALPCDARGRLISDVDLRFSLLFVGFLNQLGFGGFTELTWVRWVIWYVLGSWRRDLASPHTSRAVND